MTGKVTQDFCHSRKRLCPEAKEGRGSVGTEGASIEEVRLFLRGHWGALVSCQQSEMVAIIILLKVALGHAKCAHFLPWVVEHVLCVSTWTPVIVVLCLLGRCLSQEAVCLGTLKCVPRAGTFPNLAGNVTQLSPTSLKSPSV